MRIVGSGVRSISRRTGAPPEEDACDGLVCFAGVDWWYHNRGHSECQILTRLAGRLPILWVNTIGMRVPAPGRSELPFRRWLRKLRSTLKGLRRDACGMWVYSPLFIPWYSERSVELNGVLLRAQVDLLRRVLGIRRPSSWVTMPTTAPALERGSWRSIVFNRCDDFSAFPEVDAELISGLELRLLDRATHVVYVNRSLFERERSRVRDARYIGHGVDFEHFASARRRAGWNPAPPRLRGLKPPIVGFYGALDDYTIDLDLLIAVARHIHPASLLVIGPKAMDTSRLEAEPNVTYLGPIPYSDLPAYAARFDVGIMPWLQNRWIANCNPIKLKEYLALGFPIVTTPFPELAPYESLVYVARSRFEFLERLDEALTENDPLRVDRRRQAVAGQSWDRIAGAMAELLRVPAAARRG